MDLTAELNSKQRILDNTREKAALNLFSVAIGHELASGAFAKVKFAKLIVQVGNLEYKGSYFRIMQGVAQKLWPDVAVKIMDKKLLEAQVVYSAGDISQNQVLMQGYEQNVARESKILEVSSH